VQGVKVPWEIDPPGHPVLEVGSNPDSQGGNDRAEAQGKGRFR
jgi:hypothetical protein